MRSEPGISTEIIRAVRYALGELGFSLGRLDPIPNNQMIVEGRQADAFITSAADHLQVESLGLSLAVRIPIGALGTLDYGLSTCATLRDALQRVVRYYGVATQRARLALLEEHDAARLTQQRVIGVRDNRHWVELTFALIATRICQVLALEGKLRFRSVAFSHEAPRRREPYDEFFGTRVEFGAPIDHLEFDRSLLDRALATASPTLAAFIEQRLGELKPALAATDPILDKIRRAISSELDAGNTDLTELASQLGTSKRTLQRALSQRGTSHSKLLDELRRHRAKELLDRGERVVDVARVLGFSEPSAFIRAHRRWTGTSPRGR